MPRSPTRSRESVDASALQDTVERCYFAFRRRLRDIRQATSCECNACMLIPRLDLKVVVHHGAIVRQRMAGQEELVGSDVIVVHRLLKNTSSRPISAFTPTRCTRRPASGRRASTTLRPLGLRRARETYEVIGEVVGWVRDLEAAWAAEQERARIRVEPKEQSLWEYERILPAPPPVVWEYLDVAGTADPLASRSHRRRGERPVAGGEGRHHEPLHPRQGRDRRGDPRLGAADYLTMRFQMPRCQGSPG